MKKIIAMLLALVMLLSLAACASSGKTDAPAAADTAAPAETTDTTDTAPAADTKTDGKTYKVAMICDSSINDGGWGAACYNAMVAAAEKKGWQTEVTDSISQDSYYDSIVAYCALGYDMIYAPGNQYTDAVLQAAEEYPDVAFALLNGAVDTPEKAVNKNVSSLLPNAQQIGWIAGALAGLMTETGKLGFIGGMELDTTKGKIAGFEEAAKYVAEQEGKTVELLNVPYANSFSDAPKGKEFATELISQGADVFFGDASAVDSGAREAIDAANAAAGEIKIYDIGQPADILGQNECIICSQVTDNSAMVVASMEAVEAGTFGGETLYGTLQNGTLSAGALSDLVPADVQEKYLGYIEQMKADTFMKEDPEPAFSPVNDQPGWRLCASRAFSAFLLSPHARTGGASTFSCGRRPERCRSGGIPPVTAQSTHTGSAAQTRRPSRAPPGRRSPTFRQDRWP